MGRFGWVLLAAWVAVLAGYALLQPDPYAKGWRLVLELAFVGRAVNISDGIPAGFSKLYLLIQCGLQDIIMIMILYPWIVTGYEHARKRRFVLRTIDYLHQSAERHKHRIEPFGAVGLCLFVFFPFWSTGALVGSVVGYLLGMRTWLIFASVITGHLTSVVALIWFLDAMHEVAESFSEGIAQFLPWFVLAFLFGVALLSRYLDKRRQRNSSQDNNEPGDSA